MSKQPEWRMTEQEKLLARLQQVRLNLEGVALLFQFPDEEEVDPNTDDDCRGEALTAGERN